MDTRRGLHFKGGLYGCVGFDEPRSIDQPVDSIRLTRSSIHSIYRVSGLLRSNRSGLDASASSRRLVAYATTPTIKTARRDDTDTMCGPRRPRPRPLPAPPRPPAAVHERVRRSIPVRPATAVASEGYPDDETDDDDDERRAGGYGTGGPGQQAGAAAVAFQQGAQAGGCVACGCGVGFGLGGK